MSVIRQAIIFTTLLLGVLCLLTAYANLYNIDGQPLWFFLAYGLAGVLLVGTALRLWTRGGRTSKPRPPAL